MIPLLEHDVISILHLLSFVLPSCYDGDLTYTYRFVCVIKNSCVPGEIACPEKV